jgi:hypothetical protein
MLAPRGDSDDVSAIQIDVVCAASSLISSSLSSIESKK